MWAMMQKLRMRESGMTAGEPRTMGGVSGLVNLRLRLRAVWALNYETHAANSARIKRTGSFRPGPKPIGRGRVSVSRRLGYIGASDRSGVGSQRGLFGELGL